MAVECEFYNVIVPRSILESKYPGGVSAYRKDCPNASFVEDEHLTRVGFMNPNDTGSFMEGLITKGLDYLDENGCSKDFVGMMMFACFEPCDWLETEIVDDIKCCWLKGNEPRPITLISRL